LVPLALGGSNAGGKKPRAGLLSERRPRELGNGFGAKWFFLVGEREDLIEKALKIKQRTLFGIGLARNFGEAPS